MIKDLNKYFEFQKKIYDYFGYIDNWKVIPLSDETDEYWMINEYPDGSGTYVHSPEPITLESIEDGSKIYSGSIYTQRFLNKWVYRGPEFTMVCADTHTDGNKFLMIFDNAKECTDKSIKDSFVWS